MEEIRCPTAAVLCQDQYTRSKPLFCGFKGANLFPGELFHFFCLTILLPSIVSHNALFLHRRILPSPPYHYDKPQRLRVFKKSKTHRWQNQYNTDKTLPLSYTFLKAALESTARCGFRESQKREPSTLSNFIILEILCIPSMKRLQSIESKSSSVGI